MRRRHEQSIIDRFSEFFLEQGRSLGRDVNRFSLDGQDTELGADYIFNSGTRFTLVEFKYEERDILSEGSKPLRELLCVRLDSEQRRKLQSLNCHYISWSQRVLNTRQVMFNKYYPEVCNTTVFSADMRHVCPDTSSRESAMGLVEQFLNGNIGSDFSEFQNYTDWLMTLAGKEGTGVEVMMDNPASNELALLEFSNLSALNDYLVRNRPAPSVAPRTFRP
ncbi:TPA: hypothetical protein ACPVXZ_004807 [Vibrio parahaemolyticus]